MGRLKEVRKEIEQLCEEIERDAIRLRQHPATGREVVPPSPVRIHLVLSGKISRLRLKISLRQDHDNEDR